MSLHNKNILAFVDDYYEDLELQYPLYRLREAGAKVVIAGAEKGKTYKGKHGYPCQAEISFDSVKVNDYAALLIPGGYAPDKLRRLPKVLDITREFNKQKKPIAFICHAGWVPISAKIVKGIKATSFFAIKDDMINAGVNWVDEPVVVDSKNHFISSRTPDDLPVFCPAIIDYLAKSKKK